MSSKEPRINISTSTNTSQPDVEVILETQPQQTQSQPVGTSSRKKRSHKKKAPDEPRERPNQQPWSVDEKIALARAWLEVTEDPATANFQKEKVYWKKIRQTFHTIMGREPYRDADSLSGKFWKMKTAIQGFHSVYTRLSHNSGENDADKQSRALQEYGNFSFLREWELLRYSSKFNVILTWDPKTTRGEPSSKRSKTTLGSEGAQNVGSEARIHIDLNEAGGEGDTRETRYIRLIGRDAVKRAARTGSLSSSGMAATLKDFERLGDRLEGLMEIGTQRLNMNRQRMELEKKRMEIEEDRSLQRDIHTLAIDTSRVLEADRVAIEALKAKIHAKHV
uniref:uncharacterized protein LOC122587560 n=1 Tax=Erigeron canadensis TaxID=72917 RepID=UPI001CB967D1|nr:uncharacterized protein LOC122587560 [Erigeron canadensis]